MLAVLLLLLSQFVALGVRPSETASFEELEHLVQPRPVSSWSQSSLLALFLGPKPTASPKPNAAAPAGSRTPVNQSKSIPVNDTDEDGSQELHQTNAVGIDVGTVHGMNTWAGRRDEIWGVIKFWTMVLMLVIAAYYGLHELKKSGRSSPVTGPLKRVALAFHEDPLRMQLIWATIVFSLADVLGQTSPIYHEKNYYKKSCPSLDFRWTIAAVLNAVVFQLFVLQRIYDEMDRRLGTPTNLNAALTKAFKMLAVFIFVYTPPAILLNATLTGWVYRLLVDMSTNCVSSGFKNIIFHFKDSLWVATRLWKADFLQCFFFWPPSHMLNYILMQRWVPEFRPVWDGIVILSWNIFVLLGGSAREAVGATIFGPAPGPRALIEAAGSCR